MALRDEFIEGRAAHSIESPGRSLLIACHSGDWIDSSLEALAGAHIPS
jgi:hypothetical protein